MEKQDEAQTHEETKLWKALQPLPSQSSMQGGEIEKKSNTQQFRIPCENAKGASVVGQRSKLKKMNFASYAKSRKPCEISQALRIEEIEFPKLCEISQALQNKELKKAIFASLAKFRKACKIILCNFQIFLHRLCQIFIVRCFV